MWAAVALAMGAAVSQPAGAATSVYVASPSGDWIGQGQTTTFTTGIAAYASSAGYLRVEFSSWQIEFESPFGAALAAGNYEGATRYPFNADAHPGLSVTAPGRGCSQLQGWFEIHEVSISGSSVLAFAADLVQSCDGGPYLFAAVRINSSVPLQRVQPYARIQPELQVADEGEVVGLDGSASFDRASAVTFEWEQVAGIPVTLAGANQAFATFTAPDVAAGGEDLLFALTVRDAQGNADSTDVTVRVHDATDLRTRAFLDSDAGDWVGQGLTYWYDEANATLVTGASGTVLHVLIQGLEDWTAAFALPAGTALAPGMYAGAQRYPFQMSTRPGLSFYGEGRGCNRVGGWFEIVELQVVGSTVMRLAVDFKQHCEEGATALFGAIRINSDVPLDRGVPYAVATAGAIATEGESATLDGSASTSRDGAVTYQWTQTGGTPVTLDNPYAAVAHFTAPAVAPGGETLTFLLTVTDTTGSSDTTTVTVKIADQADPRTRAYVDSPAGDWIGAGQEYVFAAPNDPFTASATSDHNRVSVSFAGWYAEFDAPNGHAIEPGNFERATRYPFNSAANSGLSINSPGRGCNKLSGWFEVHEAVFTGTKVEHFAADFVQSCDGGPELFGAIRINSNVPLQRPEPYARVTALQVATEGDNLGMDGTGSFDRATSIASYEWTQVSGTPVTLADADTPLATFTAPDVVPGGETLGFLLTVTDTDGNADATPLEVRIRDIGDPRTRALVDSDVGDYIGGGAFYSYDEATASITMGSATSVLNVNIDGLQRWTASFALPYGGSWQPGMFAGARRYPFQQSNEPGLSFYGEGRGCNTLTGWFEIAEIQVVGTSVLRLAVDFVQHCEGMAPRLFGAIRINSSVPLDREVAYAIAAAVPPATEGEEVVLDGSQSDGRDGELTYQWTQLSGTPVDLQYANSLAATFIAPQTAPGGETLTFQLTVTDAAGHTDTQTVSVRVHDTGDARTRAYIDSPAEDWAGGGIEQSFSTPTSSFTSTVSNGNTFVSVSFDGWRLEFEAPSGRTLAPGVFEGTVHPVYAESKPGLTVSAPNRGCYTTDGWFKIHEAVFSGSTVLRFAADFERSCDGSPPLFGSVRINSAIPPEPAAPYARPRAAGVASETESVVLDGTRSFDRAGSIASYAWTQIEGPAVAIADANTAVAQFTAPSVTSTQTLRFRLVVTDNEGNTDAATTAVQVFDEAGPRTRARLESQAGDWVGQGQTYGYTEASATVTATLGTALTVHIDGEESWYLNLELPELTPWQPGMYAIATRYPFNSAKRPGLDFSGEGRGCNELLGWFEIVELQVVGNSVTKLAVDFRQHCEKGVPALFGAIRINSSVPLDRGVPYAVAPNAIVREGNPAELDGHLSWARGAAMSYAWRQTGGSNARIDAPGAAITDVTLPAGGGTYTFELTVTAGPGLVDTEEVVVLVRGNDEPQTYLEVESDGGDYIGAGRSWFFSDDTSRITIGANFDGGITVSIQDDSYWTLDLAGPNGNQLREGTYSQAQRFPFQDAGHPGLSWWGDGRGCNTLTGTFEVLQLDYATDGTVRSAAIDFEQHCEGATPAARGKLRINFVESSGGGGGGGGGGSPSGGLLGVLAALALLRRVRRVPH